MDYLKRTWAEVSLDAIKHNFNEIKNKDRRQSKDLLRYKSRRLRSRRR